jgi:hypothetical protein
MPKQEQFLVRICNCHREKRKDNFINFIAESRVDAVRLLERSGTPSDRVIIREFLEGKIDELTSHSEEIGCTLWPCVHAQHVGVIQTIEDQ